MIGIGSRVVRGPDWKWGNQDGGEGHVGTVVEVGKAGSEASPDKTVVVLWDSGARTNYRVGYDDAFDLRICDNAPAGVKHQNIICNSCKIHGISGIRFKCAQCYDYDLCSQCYMNDKHDISHTFLRFDTSVSYGVELEPRRGCQKLQLRGIFIGARVIRGPDWDWGDQDGGEGKLGRVIGIRGWENESSRSVANVTWSTGSTNVYRLGHKGKVDLKSVQGATGGPYYRSHLPVLGKEAETIENIPAVPTLPEGQRHLTFNVGDKVKVLMDIDTLKGMQEGHGGWNPRMAEYIGKIGIVHRVTDRGDIRVQYEGCNNRWTFHAGALTKINNTFAPGDIVKLTEDVQKMKELQRGHGEWIEIMANAAGKLGKVIKLYADGDLRVLVDGQTWTLNPLNVSLVPGSTTELNNTLAAIAPRSNHSSPLTSLLSGMHECHLDVTKADKLVREAAQGNISVIRDFIVKHPDKVDCQSDGKTCLQVACHQGHMKLVCFLLTSGASVEMADNEGDTALHYSAFGNQPEIMKLLLEHGANINTVNKSQCTALHVAVNKQHPHCVRVLLRHNANVNLQDSYGDTALHDAIGKDNFNIIDMLCDTPGIDYTLQNNRGFNVLHHAALKGNNYVTERVLTFARQMVDARKDDGFAALHLAALNGHTAVTETLISQGHAVVNIRNNRKQTPLLLAVSQGHCSVVELLVSMGADIMVEDEDGDTALHLALIKRSSMVGKISELESPTIFGIYQQLGGRSIGHPVALAIACYLTQEGCPLEKPNKKGKTGLDLIADTPMVDILKHYVTSSQSVEPRQPITELMSPSSNNFDATFVKTDDATFVKTEVAEDALNELLNTSESEAEPPRSIPVECTVCSELNKENILFEPCGHRIACEDCSSRMKKCLKCGVIISKRLSQDGRTIACRSRHSSAERMRYLEDKMTEIEEAQLCSICMERKRNVAFLCGHGSCKKCSLTLKICHMCRKQITKKIDLY